MTQPIQGLVPADADASNANVAQIAQSGSGIDALTRLATGNPHLVTNPGLLQALVSSNATPTQASAINAFMSGLALQQRVEHLRATGTQNQFTDEEQTILGGMHVQFDDVNMSPQQLLLKQQQNAAASNMTVATDANGNVIYGADGTPVLAAKTTTKSSSKSGGFWHDVGKVFNYVAKPFNAVSQTLGDAISASTKIANDAGVLGDLDPLKAGHDINSLITGHPDQIKTGISLGSLPADYATAGEQIIGHTPAQQNAMRDAGYDPSNPFSVIAYRAAGKDYQDTSKIAAQWEDTHAGAGQNGAPDGAAMVRLAQQFIDNPRDLTTQIDTDSTLSMDQRAAKLQLFDTPDFKQLVARVSGARAGIGNAVMSGTGISPEKHSTLYRDAAVGIDLAAGFAIDPVLVLGRVSEAQKVAQVGLEGFKGSAFGTRVHDILLGDTGGVIKAVTQLRRANVQRGMQRFIDNVGDIRSITEAGLENTPEGAQKVAKAYADIRATAATLEPLVSDFSGQSRIMMNEEGRPLLGENGKAVIGKGAPVTSLEEAADYLSSKLAFGRLSSGRAAVESTYMPGALSAFGARALIKAPLASLVGKGAALSVKNAQEAARILPAANNAIDDSNRVIAAAGDVKAAQDALDVATQAHAAALAAAANGGDVSAELGKVDRALNATETQVRLLQAQADVKDAEQGLASANRAARLTASYAGAAQGLFSPEVSGEVRANLLRRGTLDGKGFNLANMMAARSERTVRRLTSFLPRNMNIDLTDASGADKVYKFVQFFGSRGDAALAAAKYATADVGTRRTMLTGIQLQVMHSAGFGASEAGRAELDRVAASQMDNPFSAIEDTTEGHRYATNGQDLANDPRFAGQPTHNGVLPGHVQTEFTLPSFNKLAENAAKSVIWRHTFGPMYQSKTADLMMAGFKLFQLMKPSTWTRNMVEGLGNAAFRGELGAALRAKAAAIDAGIYPERGASRALNPKNWSKLGLADKVHFAPLAIVGQAYRHTALRMAGAGEGIEYIARLSKPELEQYVHDFGVQHLRADLDPGSLIQQRDIVKAGLTPGELTLDEQHELSPFKAGRASYERTGYKPETAAGRVGAARWAANLSTLVSDFPDYTKVLLDAAKANDGDMSAVLAHIKSSPELSARLDALRLRSLYQDDALGGTFEAQTDAEREIALEQLARRQVSVTKDMVTGKDGQHIDTVHNYIADNGHAPNSSWLMDNVPDEQRPFEVMAPTYIARPAQGGVDGFARALSQVTDKWYRKLVEDPIQHTTSMPVFLANYGRARVWLSDAEDETTNHLATRAKAALDTTGMTPEEIATKHAAIDQQAASTADGLMKQLAVKQAWVRTEQIIDDPGLKTQLDITGRNFFMYSRAVQAMVRRWGQAIIQDPFRLEKAALMLHAAEHTGMVYTDKNGELSFIYPGSGPLIRGITHLAGVIPGMGGFAQLPVTPDLTGKVLFAVPGLDNPFKMPVSPIVNIPYRIIESHMPAATKLNMDEWDKFINGPIGAGQIGSQFMPAALRNMMSDLSPNDRKSQWASAMVGALSNLIAADPTGAKGIVPSAGASPAELDSFLARAKIGTKNILAVRAALGLFLPAPASLPTMATAGSKADAAFLAQGIKQLRDEYQQMLNDFGGDYNQANQLWAALHPDKLVYETATSKSTAKGASLPADDATFKWLILNDNFMNKYKASAAYFIPPSTGAFSSPAYQEEMALGLRIKDTPTEFYNQVRTNQGGAVYWPSYDAYKAREAELKAAGDTAGLTHLHDTWAQYSADFKSANPLFTNSLDASTSTKDNAAADTLRNLRDMLANPKGLPSTVNVGALGHMVNAYDAYQQWRLENRGGGANGTAARNAQTANYQAYMTGLANSDPALMRLYNGVFRPLSPELIDLSVNTGG